MECTAWDAGPQTPGGGGLGTLSFPLPPSEREQKQAEILKDLIRNLKELEGQGGDPANGVSINVTNIANNHPQGGGDGRPPYTEETNRAGEGMA